ncbi:MAG: class I tRNA ligase family protein [Deltaproteobacteria bacterium]|nr:class I tRNA ligase family protein [Deltaproteobacteria bacterium]
MLTLLNTLGKTVETFRPVDEKVINIFTCGPSVYQRSHIGNFRTFLFEDIVVRYLEYSGYTVKRGMNFTDIEDKALKEAKKRQQSVTHLTEENIRQFIEEIDFLSMKIPDYLPKASDAIDQAVEIINRLLDLKVAYWNQGNVYFEPLKFPGFGEIYGLDMTRWPLKKRRFHRDTYPGMRWNLGDFILWHGYKKADTVYWDTSIGKGRPSWNIQDPSMIFKHFNETLSIYCGGFDNLFRHHDYTRAILESVWTYPMARYWLHCQHLYVNGQKMSKSKGNIYYIDTLLEQGYEIQEIRFFLIYCHYRQKLNYSDGNMRVAVDTLKKFRRIVRTIVKKIAQRTKPDARVAQRLKQSFAEKMDNDLDVRAAFNELYKTLSEINVEALDPSEASGIVNALREIDGVLKVIF